MTNDLTIHLELFLLCLLQPQGLLGEMEAVERVRDGGAGKELSFAICPVISPSYYLVRFQSCFFHSSVVFSVYIYIKKNSPF